MDSEAAATKELPQENVVGSKKRANVSSRIGNAHLKEQVQHAKKKAKSQSREVQLSCDTELSSVEMLRSLFELRCCKKTSSKGTNCILDAFTSTTGKVDANAATDLLLECQKIMIYKNKHEKEMFIQEMYRSSIARVQATGENVMSYRLRGADKIVCKKAFAFSYRTTVKLLERISSALKESETGRVGDINTKPYKDEDIPHQTFGEAEAVFAQYLGWEVAGK